MLIYIYIVNHTCCCKKKIIEGHHSSIQSPTLHVASPGLPPSNKNNIPNSPPPNEGAASSGGLGFWSFVSLAQGLRHNQETADSASASGGGVASPQCASEIMTQKTSTNNSDKVTTPAPTGEKKTKNSTTATATTTATSSSRTIKSPPSSMEQSGVLVSGGTSSVLTEGSFGKCLGCYNLLPEDWEDTHQHSSSSGGKKSSGEFESFNEGRWAADMIVSV
jgi:hypothetical protein